MKRSGTAMLVLGAERAATQVNSIPLPAMSYFNIQIQATDHLHQTPITDDDIKEILGLLGFSSSAIAASVITLSPDTAIACWPPEEPTIFALPRCDLAAHCESHND